MTAAAADVHHVGCCQALGVGNVGRREIQEFDANYLPGWCLQ